MTQSVGQEQGMCAGLHRFVHVAFHQSQFFQSFCHEAAHTHVYVIIPDARLGQFEGIVVTFFHDLIDFQLFLGKLAVDRVCAGVV